jgi:hypothetical protein
MATITKAQARALHGTVGTHLDYFRRLRERMQKVGFSHLDPLLRSVREAEDALRGLLIRLHYAGCESGVGEPSTPEPPPAP